MNEPQSVLDRATQLDNEAVLKHQKQVEQQKTLDRWNRERNKAISALIRTEELPPSEADFKKMELFLFLFRK